MRVVPTSARPFRIWKRYGCGTQRMQAPGSLRGALPCNDSLTRFVSGFVHANRQSDTRNQRVWDWVRVGMVILAKFDNHSDTVLVII